MTFSKLLTQDGWELVNSLPPYDANAVFTLSTRLREEGFDSDLISAALTQSRLRDQARTKFGEFASGMLLTQDGLEQATRLSVGAFHAQRFRDAHATRILDFGCGIGADSMAFAALGLATVGIERDPDAAAAATMNLRHFPESEVFMADGNEVDIHSFGADAIWIDPARRAGGHRIKNPQEWQPSLDRAIELAREFPAAGIKVAPGIDYGDLPQDAHVEWISYGGDLLEAVIWLGDAAPRPGRTALLITDSGHATWGSGVVDPRLPAIEVIPDELGPFIFEPDPAIIRSGSIMSICEKFDLAPVSSSIAYLTGNEPIDSPYLTGFTVLGVYPIEAKALRPVLTKLGIGSVEIKKRGTQLVPEAFRKKLKLDTSLPGSATLIATPLLGKHRMILAERT